eukprot:g2438.t1
MVHTGNGKKTSVMAKICGSSVAGISEICLFHPIDTVAKRLMNNKTKLRSVAEFRHTVLGGHSALRLYSGLTAGFLYKVSQRTYKYGGQAYLNETFRNNYGLTKLASQSLSGCLIGMGEVFLLPLDILKIRKQLFPEKYASRSMFEIMRNEGASMYNGTCVTMLRNGLGSTALFGANQLTRQYLLGIEDRRATLPEICLTSTVASLASLFVSSPFDVVKVRVQADPDGNLRARNVMPAIIRNEGMGALFKGMGPKVMVIGPKLVFSFTIAQYVISRFDDALSARKNETNPGRGLVTQ